MKSLVAVATALFVAACLGAVSFAAPTAAAGATRAVSLTSTYTCKLPGDQTGSSKVTLGTSLPRSVKAGSRVAARQVSASITIPRKFVDFMRQYGVTSVSGTASDAKYRVGKRRVTMSDLMLPSTPVPARGGMKLRGSGTADAFRISKPGTYTVRIPASFSARVLARTRSYGDVAATLTCRLAKGAPSELGSLTVR